MMHMACDHTCSFSFRAHIQLMALPLHLCVQLQKVLSDMENHEFELDEIPSLNTTFAVPVTITLTSIMTPMWY